MTLCYPLPTGRCGIAWTDDTLNPLLYGCGKVSPACRDCYAEAMAVRLARMGQGDYAPAVRDGRWTGRVTVGPIADAIARVLAVPRRRDGGLRYVFVTSMSDILHEDVPLDWIVALVEAMSSRPDVIWQLLTKRAERWPDVAREVGAWPANVWPGVTVENQHWADKRIPFLLEVPAAIRWLSVEPMLGDIDIFRLIRHTPPHDAQEPGTRGHDHRRDLAGGLRDRLGGSNLETQETWAPRERARGGASMLPRASGESLRQGWLFDGAPHGRRETGACFGPPDRVPSERASDPGRMGDQPHQWDEGGQPAGESGGGDILGQHAPCAPDGTARPTGRGQPIGHPDERSGGGHPGGVCGRQDHPTGPRGQVWGRLSDDLEDRSWRAPAEPERQHGGLHEASLRHGPESAGLHFVVVGGESGKGWRPLDWDAVRRVRDDCGDWGAAFFFKQAAGLRPRKDLGDCPADLRVREMPRVVA